MIIDEKYLKGLGKIVIELVPAVTCMLYQAVSWMWNTDIACSFEKSSRHDSYVPRFEAELAEFCEKLVKDLDEVTPPLIPCAKSEQILVLEGKIKRLLDQVEALGEAGKADEAKALMNEVDILNTEKLSLQQPAGDKVLMLTQEKNLVPCEKCGSVFRAECSFDDTDSSYWKDAYWKSDEEAKRKRI